jgi:hypothetical protein
MSKFSPFSEVVTYDEFVRRFGGGVLNLVALGSRRSSDIRPLRGARSTGHQRVSDRKRMA